MDKFFIQNAFKTLDEIEASRNTNSLKEDVQEKVEETQSLDLDELASKFIGKECVVVEDGDYVNEHGTINALTDFEGDFEKSVWEVALDIGVIINVTGKNLSVILEEKIPHDLAKAYRSTAFSDSKKVNLDSPLARAELALKNGSRRSAYAIDFNNASYEEISKEEALKKYSKAGERCKLRVIVAGRLVQWDENNLLLTSLPGGVNRSFKNIIELADKIYVTDEIDHIQTRPEELSTEKEQADKDDIAALYSQDSPDVDIYSTKMQRAIRTLDRQRSLQQIPDTGYHAASTQAKRLKRAYLDAVHNFEQGIRKADKPGTNINSLTLLQLKYEVKKKQDTYMQFLKLHRGRDAASLRGETSAINLNLARLIVYKALGHEAAFKFKKLDKALQDQSRYIPELRDTAYASYLSNIAIIQGNIDDLNEWIKGYTKRLNAEIAKLQQLKSEEDADAKEEYENKAADILQKCADEYEKYLAQANKLLRKAPIVKESLKESLKSFRIYSVDKNGKEDFIDDNSFDEESIIDRAKELMQGGDYQRIVAVSTSNDSAEIEILWDSEDNELAEKIEDKRSIGQIVDDLLAKEKNESLNESKKFNLNNPDDLVNAKVYKGVSEKTEEPLVVVDPNYESLDSKNEAHAGDAILICHRCHTPIFKKVDELVKDESTGLYNVGEECPHCHDKSGFEYSLQAALKPADGNLNAIEAQPKEAPKAEEQSEGNSETPVEGGLPAVEDDFVDLNKINDVKEESFNKLATSYLTKLYENVNDFKMTEARQAGRNKIILEGIITGKNGKELDTQFEFNVKETAKDSILFEGYNNLLTEQKDAFKLKSIKDKDGLIFESLNYNYKVKDQLVEGLETTK